MILVIDDALLLRILAGLAAGEVGGAAAPSLPAAVNSPRRPASARFWIDSRRYRQTSEGTLGAMRVSVDADLCSGCGYCVAACPEVFTHLGPDGVDLGISHVLDRERVLPPGETAEVAVEHESGRVGRRQRMPGRDHPGLVATLRDVIRSKEAAGANDLATLPELIEHLRRRERQTSEAARLGFKLGTACQPLAR